MVYRKGVEDFVYLLIVAIVIIVALSIFSGIGPFIAPAENFTVISEFSLGPVGFAYDYPARTESLGSFAVGETQRELLKSVPKMRVIAGLFGAESNEYRIDVPEWLRETMKGVKITFSVEDRAPYGNLIIKWNGKEFYNEQASGAVTVTINSEYVKSSNNLEILAGSPGWYFWANTVYEIRNFNVNLEYGPAKLIPFEIFPNELESWNKGELSFYSIGTGTLSVKINGIEIYNQNPDLSNAIGFEYNDAPLKVGNNIISLSSPEGVLNLQNVELKIFLLTNEIVRTRDFNITAGQYNALKQGKKGRIDYTIDSISREGILKIKLNNNMLSVPAPVTGLNSVYFTSGQAREGENRLEFSGTGTWYISEVDVGIEI